ncbi:pentapeptide repeat-containing protein [Streptomyces chattanoogensis]|uniref:pentapeptide repeat-containing protein n=1 Tax=Streptomyces chattanoogensis TaxID=66876 RepID=UPI0036A8B6A2
MRDAERGRGAGRDVCRRGERAGAGPGGGQVRPRQGLNGHGLNLRGLNLRGLNLRGLNLRGLNLRGLNLRGKAPTPLPPPGFRSERGRRPPPCL